MSSESSGNGSASAAAASAASAAANASSAVAAAAAVPASSHASLGKIGVIRLEADYKHPNSMSVEEFFSGNAAAALGRSDFSAQIKILSQHMVETVADLRLLVSENQLRELGLPIRLCVWIEEEIAKLGGPVGGVNVSVPNQTPSLPPIPLSAPIVPKPQPASVSLPPIAPVSAALLASPDKVGLLQFAHDFDQQGLMYYLGSRGCTTVWSNPMEAGYVNVTASSVSANSSPLSAIVGRETVRFVTNSGDASYIQVEIKDFFIKPTNYSLKHYSSYDNECLRDWKLEGSVDGSNWVLLKEHKGDTNLNAKGATCTWNITPDEPQNFNQTPSIPFASPQGNPAFASQLLIPSLALSSTKHWYRFFRVTMLGPNSNQHTYLACSGLEIYGYVLSKNQMQAWLSGGSVASIPTFMSANYPPWVLPRDSVLQIQQQVNDGSKSNKQLANSASNEDLNSTLDGLEDDYKVPSSIAALSNQLNNLSFADGVPIKDALHRANSMNNGANAAGALSVNVAAASANNASGASANAGVFTYSSDFDRNGIIWALSTGNGMHSWENAMEAGRVMVYSSSLMEDSTPLSAVVGRETVRCVTKPLPNSWIMLDFQQDKKLVLTHYTLKHYSSWETECLRSWRIEATNGDPTNERDWIVLREHVLDENLNGKGGTFTWSISGGDLQNALRQQQPFRFLRLFQTGENSNKHHYLPCSGLELYGKLFGSDGVTPYVFHAANSPQNPAVRSFLYQSNFDQNGILYWLATGNYSRPWSNPAESGLIRLAASSLNEDSEPLSALVGTRTVRCVSQPIPDQWFSFDFGPTKVIQPTAYTLRHYSSWDTECLRNWRFQGSTDSNPATANWVTITEHRDDASLEGKGSSHTWFVNTTRFFRMFRIFQFDKNSNKHHYLACSGFELYGSVKEVVGAAALENNNNGGAVPAPFINNNINNNNAYPAQVAAAIAAPAPIVAYNSNPLAQQLPLPALPIPQPIPSPQQQQQQPVAVAAPSFLDVFDFDAKGQFLVVSPNAPSIVRNSGSQDKWQMARGRLTYASGVQKFSIRISEDPVTTNTWRFIIGCVPITLDCKGAKQWVGTSMSFGYISGTGGKCHNTAVSNTYGSKFGHGDIITVYMNFSNKCLGFFRNDEFQGIAFTNLSGPVFAAASLTATGSALEFVPTPPLVNNQIASMQIGQIIPAPMAVAPIAANNPAFLTAWDPSNKSVSLVVDPVTGYLRNTGSNDKWQSCRSLKPFSASGGPRHRFDISLVDCPKTNNSWQVIVGVVPATFTCSGNKQWVGAGESWGYIGGTGGKCFNAPKSQDYGEKFGRTGDTITVLLDFERSTIEFLKNGISQGTAFNNLSGTVFAAVSLTATGATARLNIAP